MHSLDFPRFPLGDLHLNKNESDVKSALNDMNWMKSSLIEAIDADARKKLEQERARGYNADSLFESSNHHCDEDKSSVDPNRAPGTMDVSEIMEAFDDLAAPGISSSPHEPYNSPSVELLKVIQKDFGSTGVSPKDVHDLVDDFGDVDMSALDTAQAMLFERKTTCRPSAPAPIDIPERVRPKGHPGTFRCKGRRPLEDLWKLDQHAWDTEVNILGKWARGAGIGRHACSITEEMFTPSSPPCKKKAWLPHRMYVPITRTVARPRKN